ncbi:MAG TPA: IS91 family transposase [Bryobacteraceae bacterium]|nr:IS91 family transposase [Bryobacteraceae bacterium]
MRPALEVADIVRAHGEEFRRAHAASLSPRQKRALRNIERCRTAALGGHLEQCDQCGHQRNAYNSCADRHCPKCQSLARAKWLEQRRAELLPVEYFHVVFTLPEPLAQLCLQNQREMYNLLFRAASETLLTIAADPQHLGARIGFFCILHTWGQTLTAHPHLHCVVPGGGISLDGSHWVSCRPGFFLPVTVLSQRFRNVYLGYLEKAYAAGKLRFAGGLETLAGRITFIRYLDKLRQMDWVVYAKPPFGGPERVLEYLGRYTHRVAISNNRLREYKNGQVTFTYKDYKHEQKQKVMTLSADEFLRRFLLHVLPDGFQRIRHYGLLGNRHRAEHLARCRELLAVPTPIPPAEPKYHQRRQQLSGQDPLQCPQCKTGHMVRIAILAPAPRPAPIWNSS